MIQLSIEEGNLIIHVDDGDLAPRHENQLAYWELQYDSKNKLYISQSADISKLLNKLIPFLKRSGLRYDLSKTIQALVDKQEDAVTAFHFALEKARTLKDGTLDEKEAKEFVSFLKTNINRPLKEHQIKAALHLLSAQNGANFSVPGSGKTSVVLAVFDRLRRLNQIDSLFVVGPPACFGPWRMEYEEVLGVKPIYEILAGGDIEIRRSKYLVNRDSACDLYLTTFQTLQRDWEQVKLLFEIQGVRFFLVVDEAHYIKQLDGAWANAVLNVAQHATRRCILTGTPFPRSYMDAFNLFDFLWPYSSPIPAQKRHKIELYTQRNELDRAAEELNESIGPLFYRVRKEDLGLAPQHFLPPVRINMNKYERLAYESLFDRIMELSQSDYLRDLDLSIRLRRGRMMRLRQCLSYTVLLGSAVTEYNENLFEENMSLADIIKHYDKLEKPAKLEILLSMVNDLMGKGEKIVIWSNFVQTLKLLNKHISKLGYGVHLIYGGTPIQSTKVHEELSREEKIREFVQQDSVINVLVANPAACAESISLHKTCSHAIYYDLSYNCAQYLQSLDRIHRVGGSEKKAAYYHFLQYEDTIDNDILINVQTKAKNMSAIIDQDFAIYSLDMFEEDEEELDAYERLFGKQRQRV